MLVLSRQRDETIMIGDLIEITIVDIRGDKVRLGINAPREVQVHRKEVYDAIRRENTEASHVEVDDLAAMNRKFTPGKIPGKISGNIPGNIPGNSLGVKPGDRRTSDGHDRSTGASGAA